MILLSARGEKSRSMGVTDQTKGFAGNAEPTFYLRTDGNILDKCAQAIGEKPIQFMRTVPTNSLSEQTSADS